MSVVKALAGGLIGGAVGAFGAQLVSPTSQWPVVLAGVLAGIGVRVACRAERSFITGVTAAVAALLAISGVSYFSSLQASKTAEQSMAEIAAKPNYKGDAAVTTAMEPSTDDADQVDLPNESAPEESAAPGTVDEIEVTPVDSNVPDPAAADQAAAEVAELNDPESTPNMPDDQRPAQLEPSDDLLLVGTSSARSTPQDSLPLSMMLFHGLAALAAFVLGSGSASATKQH